MMAVDLNQDYTLTYSFDLKSFNSILKGITADYRKIKQYKNIKLEWFYVIFSFRAKTYIEIHKDNITDFPFIDIFQYNKFDIRHISGIKKSATSPAKYIHKKMKFKLGKTYQVKNCDI